MHSSLLSLLTADKRPQKPTFKEHRECLCRRAIKDTDLKVLERGGAAGKCNLLLGRSGL